MLGIDCHNENYQVLFTVLNIEHRVVVSFEPVTATLLTLGQTESIVSYVDLKTCAFRAFGSGRCGHGLSDDTDVRSFHVRSKRSEFSSLLVFV